MRRIHSLKYFSIALLLTILAVSPAAAAFEEAVEAYQPIVTREGIVLCQVTTIRYYGSPSSSEKVYETDKPNSLWTQEGFQNRNIANLLGIKVNTKYNPNPPGGLFGDTLKIEIRADSIKTDSHWPLSHVDPDTAVLATIECVLANTCTEKDVRIVTIDVYRKPKARPLRLKFDLHAFNAYPRRKYFTSP
jgi:hypothetical protein